MAILTADCVPVLFADRDNGVIGAAHAGWRGANGGILESTVNMMCANGATLVCIYQLLPVGTSVNGMPLSMRGFQAAWSPVLGAPAAPLAAAVHLTGGCGHAAHVRDGVPL